MRRSKHFGPGLDPGDWSIITQVRTKVKRSLPGTGAPVPLCPGQTTPKATNMLGQLLTARPLTIGKPSARLLWRLAESLRPRRHQIWLALEELVPLLLE